MGKVRITIGPALQSNLDETNHRKQSHEIPKPANHQIRTRLPPGPYRDGDASDEQRCQCHLPEGKVIGGVWIKYRESRRPDHLTDVIDVTEKSIADSRGQRQL